MLIFIVLDFVFISTGTHNSDNKDSPPSPPPQVFLVRILWNIQKNTKDSFAPLSYVITAISIIILVFSIASFGCGQYLKNKTQVDAAIQIQFLTTISFYSFAIIPNINTLLDIALVII